MIFVKHNSPEATDEDIHKYIIPVFEESSIQDLVEMYEEIESYAERLIAENKALLISKKVAFKAAKTSYILYLITHQYYCASHALLEASGADDFEIVEVLEKQHAEQMSNIKKRIETRERMRNTPEH